MKRLSIKNSLTAWFVGLTTVLLVAFSGTLYYVIDRTLRRSLDAVLSARAETLFALCDYDEDRHRVEFELPPEVASTLAITGRGRGCEVREWPSGHLLYQSGEPIQDELPPVENVNSAGSRPDRIEVFTNMNGGEPRRRCMFLAQRPPLSATKEDPAKPGFSILIRITDSRRPVETQLAQVAGIIIFLAAVSLLFILAFGFFLSRIFVRPLKDLGSAAAEVKSGGRQEMPKRGNGDEVDVLANTLDDAFASLRESVDRQTRFTANAAHELRNPIAVIRNASEIALRSKRPTEEYAAFLEDILITSKRMGEAVDGLLLLARMDADVAHHDFKNVDLNHVIHESVDTLREHRERIVVSNGAKCVVRGDSRLLRILVDNLLSNALRHSPSGSPVRVASSQENGHVVLEVVDRGEGISAKDSEHVFERFYRASGMQQNGTGAGLGLSIVAEVVRIHDAKCELKNQKSGLTVVVKFASAG